MVKFWIFAIASVSVIWWHRDWRIYSSCFVPASDVFRKHFIRLAKTRIPCQRHRCRRWSGLLKLFYVGRPSHKAAFNGDIADWSKDVKIQLNSDLRIRYVSHYGSVPATISTIFINIFMITIIGESNECKKWSFNKLVIVMTVYFQNVSRYQVLANKDTQRWLNNKTNLTYSPAKQAGVWHCEQPTSKQMLTKLPQRQTLSNETVFVALASDVRIWSVKQVEITTLAEACGFDMLKCTLQEDLCNS